MSLEEAGFIGGFLPLSKAKRRVYYRIIDEYIFYLTWIEPFRGVAKKAIISDAHCWELAVKKPAWKHGQGKHLKQCVLNMPIKLEEN
ncbi:hypothetical protein [Wolbachia endosymbiont of Mansonella ozzardi]|uniref:hypothetical protein n=1 Tax=Wolbachia endosymbiont of Mansonella ozzardi TaxID=137464 RepID=UPI001CE12BA0|nr:hypothetical protein [Wolbachia endosymbiont of Mansonella ozzardi]